MSNRMRKHGKARRAPVIMKSVMMTFVPLFLFTGTFAHAHGVYIFAWVEGDTVHTESYFNSKKKVKGGIVKVFDTSGTILLEGKTDDKGEYSFKLPGKSPLLLVLEASTGHRAEFQLGEDELADIMETPASSEVSKDPPKASALPSQEDVDQLRKIVEEALDEKLKSITRTLAKIQEDRGPGLTEVIGGIGYIVGIMGIIMYIRTKKKP